MKERGREGKLVKRLDGPRKNRKNLCELLVKLISILPVSPGNFALCDFPGRPITLSFV